MIFDEHGSFELSVKDNIIFTLAEGPYNKELIISFIKARKEAIESLNGEPFILIADMKESSIFVPDALELLIEENKKLKKMGEVASIAILHHQEGEGIMKGQLNNVTFDRIHFCYSVEEAFEKAKELLSKL